MCCVCPEPLRPERCTVCTSARLADASGVKTRASDLVTVPGVCAVIQDCVG